MWWVSYLADVAGPRRPSRHRIRLSLELLRQFLGRLSLVPVSMYFYLYFRGALPAAALTGRDADETAAGGSLDFGHSQFLRAYLEGFSL